MNDPRIAAVAAASALAAICGKVSPIPDEGAADFSSEVLSDMAPGLRGSGAVGAV